jgi:hypothetical protein
MLRSNNVEQVTSYIKLKYEYLESRNAFRRAAQLSLPGNRHAFAERLDADVVKASLDAEKRVKRFGEPAWSVALNHARRKVGVLKKCLSKLRTGIAYAHALQKEIDEGNLGFQIPNTSQECKEMLREARSALKVIVRESYQRRDQERKEKLAALEQSAKKSDKAQATRLRRQRRAEEIKQVFDKLKATRIRGHRPGVTRLEIPRHPDTDPKSCTEWRTIDVPTEIVEQLQHRNQQHFSQAKGTPFTIDPLWSDLGFNGDTSEGDDILSGVYPVNPFPEPVRLLIQHLQITQELSTAPTYPTISLPEFEGKIKAWRESTTTSPSGIHLGHYKCLFARHKYSNVDDMEHEEHHCNTYNQLDQQSQQVPSKLALKREYDHMQSALAELHLNMVNYALERGYSYHRWQRIANTILFKDPGCIKINRTRVIHIYEADFNLMLGLKWRIALYQSEALQQLNDGQYGSRPRRNAIDPVLIEELQFEVSRLSRRMLIQTNYDATACYDRIIPNLAMLASRKFGVPKSVTQSNANTLQKAQFHVRTELGLSTSSYSHSEEKPIYGTGQGSGNSPMIWCFISSLLFDCYDTLSYAATYCHPDRTQPLSVSMIGFVDDCNGQVNSFNEHNDLEALQRLVEKAKINANVWSQLLTATGGALELTKCSYHVLFWKFSIKGAPVLSNINSEILPLQVTDSSTAEPQTLKYLPPSVAHKTLGHYKEPVGTQKAQFRNLKAKSDSITDFLWTTHLTREESWIYYQACYLPAIAYPLTGSSLTRTQLDSIQRKAMKIIVAACGFNRNTKKEVLYGPIDLGGANFKQLYIQQGISQTQYFIRHWRMNSKVGKLLRCTMAWIHFSVGTSYSILERVHEQLPHCESIWVSSLRSFLSSIDAMLYLDEPSIPRVQRESDQHLMDMILASRQFKPGEIRRLNYCRLYLQAITLSDITKPNGTELDLSMVSGTSSLYSSTTRWHTIHQERPSHKEWQLWKKANLLWSNANGQLNSPLGAWIVQLPHLRRQFFAYIYHRTLYIRNKEDLYEAFRQTGNNKFRPSMSLRPRAYHLLPSRARPVDVQMASDCKWKIIGTHSPVLPKSILPPSSAATFDLYISTLETWESELLQHIQLNSDPYSVVHDLTPGFRAASDGSVQFQHNGSFGWIVSTRQGIRVATGMGPVRGRRPTPYRAEAYGLWSFLRFLIRIKEFTGMHESWNGILYTDGKSVLDTLKTGDPDPHDEQPPVPLDRGAIILDVLCPEWDVLIAIQSALSALPEVQLRYVKGHQDRKQPYRTLALSGQLNVDADKLADVYQNDFGATRPIVLMAPLTHAHLIFPDGTVTGKYSHHLQNKATEQPLLDYIQSKNAWSDCLMQNINWEAHRAALKRSQVPHTHLVKMLHDILPTTSQANKMDGGKRQCPTCTTMQEDRDHILKCPHESRRRWRTAFLTGIQNFHCENRTCPHLRQLMQDSIRNWFQSSSKIEIDPAQYHDKLRAVIKQQNRIGWRQLIHGRFGVAWSIVQTHYLRSLQPSQDTNTSGIKWQTSLILFVWDKWYTLWKQRNHDLHGNEISTTNQSIQQETKRQLNDIYQHRHMYEPQVQALLYQDVNDHDKHPIIVTRNWLATNRGIFSESLRRVKKRALKGMKSLRTYFDPQLDLANER